MSDYVESKHESKQLARNSEMMHRRNFTYIDIIYVFVSFDVYCKLII